MEQTSKLIPLDSQYGPSFPVETLPQSLSEYVQQVAYSYQVPVDLPAVLALSTCSAVIGKQYRIQVKPDWQEACNLYTMIAMPPASRKSPVFKSMTGPLLAAEKRYFEEHQQQMINVEQKRRIISKSIKQAESTASKAESHIERQKAMENIEQLKKEMPEQIKSFRLLADDVTSEKVVSLLAENNGRFAIMSAEGGIFDTLAGRYSSNVPNFDVFLKGHAGDMIRVDRMGRESEFIDSPTLTVALTLQPEILKNIEKNPGFRGRGLLGRFLYVLPPNAIGYREIDTPSINPAIKANYDNLLRLQVNELLSFEANPHQKPKIIKLSLSAKDLFREFQIKCESDLRPGGRLEPFSDWAGKLAGTLIRIAGVLHIVKYGANAQDHEIDKETMNSAITIGHYFIGHAEIAFNLMQGDPAMEKANKIISWMIMNEISIISARDIQQALRADFKKINELRPILKLLIEYGQLILEQENIQSSSKGRKPSPRYRINPELLSQNTHFTQESENVYFL